MTRFRHRYTEKSLLDLINTAIDAEEKLGSAKRWAFHIYHMKDPLGKLWFNVVLFSAGAGNGIPRYIRDDYEMEGCVRLFRALDRDHVAALKEMSARMRTETPPSGSTILRYAQRDTGIFDRVENFLPLEPSIESETLAPFVLPTAAMLLDDPQACIFKDKINYKPPKLGSFPAHQDAAAGWAVDSGQRYLTAAVAIDACTSENGALQIVRGGHKNGLLAPLHTTFPPELEASLVWEEVPLAPGDCLLFSSHTPHRSADNNTSEERRLLLVTYRTFCAAHKEERADFFKKKRFRQPTIDDDPSISLVKDSFGKWVRPDVPANGAEIKTPVL